MTISIPSVDVEGEKNSRMIEHKPDTCPLCNHGIDPVVIYAYDTYYDLQLVCRCTRLKCQKLFIAYYSCLGRTSYIYLNSAPKAYIGTSFSDEINKISPKFQGIYNDAEAAEARGLEQVCGCGYRKALEFLVKDFVIDQVEDEELKEKIARKVPLGKVISDHIEDRRIKALAERATWLGNDETHYTRKWEEMGLDELKDLIGLVVNFIVSIKISDKYIKEMPHPTNNKAQSQTPPQTQ